MPISDYAVALAPLYVLDKRLTFHIGKGRLLEGLKYDYEGKIWSQGLVDMPFIQPEEVFEEEDRRVTGGANAAGSGNNATADALRVTYRIVVNKKNGMFARKPTTDPRKRGITDWTALIRDAIETNEDGVVDAKLDGTTLGPIRFNISDNFIDETAWEVKLEIIILTRAMSRGTRHAPNPAAP